MLSSDRTDPTVVSKARREARSLLDQFKTWKAKEAKRLKAESKAEGKAEGVAQGIDKAVEDLLVAAAAHLPPETIEVLRKQRDPSAILAAAMAGARR